MYTSELSSVLTHLFSELVDGATDPGGAFVLNAGDPGLLRSLEKLSASGMGFATKRGRGWVRLAQPATCPSSR